MRPDHVGIFEAKYVNRNGSGYTELSCYDFAFEERKARRFSYDSRTDTIGQALEVLNDYGFDVIGFNQSSKVYRILVRFDRKKLEEFFNGHV
jgi:hypothetical protein